MPAMAAVSLLLSPCGDLAAARAWLAQSGGALDGVVAKRLDQPYRPGERAMLKVKQHRTADCVVGGFRRAKDGGGVASLLLGLYDERRPSEPCRVHFWHRSGRSRCARRQARAV